MEDVSRVSRNKQKMTKRQLKKYNKAKYKKYKKFKKKTKKRGFFGTIWAIIVTLLMLVIFTVGGVALGGGIYGFTLFQLYQDSTPELVVEKLANATPSKVYDTNDTLIAEVGIEERVEIDIDDVPKAYLDALVSTEDNRFFSHNGFDVIRTVQAAIKNVTSGFGSEGGSTLTQQLIKLSFLDQNDTSLKRKTHEVTLAWELESKYSKEEILNMYINKIYMGDGVYGVETAAEHFYGKKLSELNTPQLALLAGIPQSPTNWNPYDNPEGATDRRNTVLYRMLDEATITQAEYDRFKAVPVTDGLVPAEESRNKTKFFVPTEYQLYVDSALEEVKENTGLDPLINGLNIKIALDTHMQEFSNRMTNTNDLIAYQNSDMLAAFTIIENKTGRVIANGSGNRDIDIVQGGFNYATDTVRQAGSTMKPVLGYAPAVEYLNYGGGTMIMDGPYKYSTGQTLNNWDFQYKGNITLARALGSSRNIPAVKLQSQVGTKKAYELANKIGFNFEENQQVESGVISMNANPLQMAQAYSTFANNGKFTPAHTVVSVKDSTGKEVYKEPEGKQAIKESTAYVVTSMLRTTADEPYGTAYNQVYKQGNQVAIKTGTTNYDDNEKSKYGLTGSPDSWVVGYTESYTIAIWLGNDTRTDSLNNTEKNLNKDMFNLLLKELGVKNESFDVPNSVYQNGGFYYPKK